MKFSQYPGYHVSARGNYAFRGPLKTRDRMKKVSELFREIGQTLEPILYLGPEKFAPGTDWWGIVAANCHVARADSRMYDALSKDERVTNE